jgi:hypothetical protein
MPTLALDGTAVASNPAAHRGGGSRRCIYAPAKLDPNAASWMANKLQSAT